MRSPLSTWTPRGSYFQEELRLVVNNDAPLSLPLFAPDFAGHARIKRSDGSATCRVFVQSGWKSCATTQVEIGRIWSGESGEMVFSIDPRGGSFEVVVSAYPKLIAGLPDSVREVMGCGRSVVCSYLAESETYVCG